MVKSKRAQSEIVGFVIIVVIVVVIAMIFLIISVRKTEGEVKSQDLDNLLSALMKYTTDCAIVFEPQYSSFQDLIRSCYKSERCSNLGKDACDYLNETSVKVIGDLMKTESKVADYQFVISQESGELVRLGSNCTGTYKISRKLISTGSDNLDVVLRFCY